MGNRSVVEKEECTISAATPLHRDLNLGIGFVYVSATLLLLSVLSWLTDQHNVAFGVFVLWVLVAIAKNPAYGIIFALSFQVIDVVFNPSAETGYEWLTFGRIIPFIVIISYLFHHGILSLSEMVKNNRPVLFFVFFLFWGFLSCTWAEMPLLGLWTMIKYLANIGMMIIAIRLFKTDKLLKFTLIMLVIGSAAGAIYTLVGDVALRTDDSAARLGLAGIGINTIGISIGFAIISAIALMVLYPSPFTNFISAASIIAMITPLLRTGTRSSMIGIFIAMGVSILINWRHIRKQLKYIMLGGVAFAASFYFFLQRAVVTGKALDRIQRIFDTSMYQDDVRWQIFRENYQLWQDHPFGVGPGHEAYFVTGLSAVLNESHNTFLSVLVEFNPIGLALFSIAIVMILVYILRLRSPAYRLAASLIFIFILFTMLKGSFQHTRLLWHPLMLVLMIVGVSHCQDNKKEIPNLDNN